MAERLDFCFAAWGLRLRQVRELMRLPQRWEHQTAERLPLS